MSKGTDDIEKRSGTDRRDGTDRREVEGEWIVTEVILAEGERIYERRTGSDRRSCVDRRRGTSVDISL